MGPHRASLLLFALLLACLVSGIDAHAQIQVVYMESAQAGAFVDADEPTQAYVVGFGNQASHQPPSRPHRSMLMRSANGTSYRCYIPDPNAAGAGGDIDGMGTDGEGSLLTAQKTPSQLLEVLTEHCNYRIEEWWTYELCYKKRLRQYHKESGKLVSQYILGTYDESQPPADEVQVDSSEVSGALKYVSQQYVGGDACELTGKPRQAEVRFTCGSSDDTLLTSIKELASCHYVATISTPHLCKHPSFQQQPQPATLIQCHPLSAGEAATAAAAGGTTHCSSGTAQQADGTCAAELQPGAAVAEVPEAAVAAAPSSESGGEAPGDAGAPASATAVVVENSTQEEEVEEQPQLEDLVERQGDEGDEYE